MDVRTFHTVTMTADELAQLLCDLVILMGRLEKDDDGPYELVKHDYLKYHDILEGIGYYKEAENDA